MKKLLIIGSVWPEPNSSAAGSRMLQLISFFQEEKYAITFASAAMDSEFMIDLTQINISKKAIHLNNANFDEYIKELNPSVVLFDRFMTEEQFGWRVTENCPSALKLLDTEDLHCLRIARQKAIKRNELFHESDLLKEEVAKREIASILRCDLSLMISEYEITLLTKIFNISNDLLIYIPFLLEKITLELLQSLPKFEEKKHFVFIGNFLHEPNWDAVQYLKQIIWPKIKDKLPEAVLNIYGAYPSQKVLQLNDKKSGFIIQGRAKDASEVVKKSRVVLAPIRFGAGLKGKLIEAMQCGTPSVTTTIGAESMHGELPWNGFIYDDPEAFATAAVSLYTNEETWIKSKNNAISIINERYFKTIYLPKLKSKIEYLITNTEEHRLKNFYGSMLRHHTLNSTKYMSRWIEAKNKA